VFSGAVGVDLLPLRTCSVLAPIDRDACRGIKTAAGFDKRHRPDGHRSEFCFRDPTDLAGPAGVVDSAVDARRAGRNENAIDSGLPVAMDSKGPRRAPEFVAGRQCCFDPRAGLVVASPDIGFTLSPLDNGSHQQQINRRREHLSIGIRREGHGFQRCHFAMPRPQGQINFPGSGACVQHEYLRPGNVFSSARVHPVAIAGVQSSLVRDEMHDLGAADRLSGGPIDHARPEGLLPAVSGGGLGNSRGSGVGELDQQQDRAALVHNSAEFGPGIHFFSICIRCNRPGKLLHDSQPFGVIPSFLSASR